MALQLELSKSTLSDQDLFSQFEELLRTMPERATFRHHTPENIAWQGRALNLVKMWDPSEFISFSMAMGNLETPLAALSSAAINQVMRTVHHAHSSLQMKVAGPTAILVDQGKKFVFFNEVRKLIESAKLDLLFVDEHLDANFLETYAPYIPAGVKVRLLTRNYIPKLIPAIKAFKQQAPLDVEVKKTDEIHGRYIFIDNTLCYTCDASFKDGTKYSPAALIQIADAFEEFYGKFQSTWLSASTQNI